MENPLKGLINAINMPKISFKPLQTLKNVFVSLDYIENSVYIGNFLQEKAKDIIIFFIDVLISGFMINLSLIPLYFILFMSKGYIFSPSLIFILIISYGVGSYVVSSIWGSYIDGKKEINRALPRQ